MEDMFQTDLAQHYFGVMTQYPNSLGVINNLQTIIDYCHEHQCKIAVGTDLMALSLIKPPGSMGADIAYGSSQRFGVPMGYGGPHAGFFACKKDYVRQMPGRIIGVSRDKNGKKALRIALQTREQHIRRDKATSNICTAQVLLAIISSFYAVWHGPKGIKHIANVIHNKTLQLASLLEQNGLAIKYESFFDTIVVYVPLKAKNYMLRARSYGVNLRMLDSDHIAISLDETTKNKDIDNVLKAFFIQKKITLNKEFKSNISHDIQRVEPFLTHKIFNSFQSETQMMRYIRYLADKDLALDRTMIPLGSCTMKLNAVSEMLPVTWREFSQMHPFVPQEQAEGYLSILIDLEQWLCTITGFDAVSLQPNSGAQGEYTGLLCIRRYHEYRQESHRNICLIPQSAHGTNGASAVICGMEVKTILCDEYGNVDINHVKSLAEEYKDTLAALMITYPSTHGVF